MKTKTIWIAKPVGYSYVGESRIWGDEGPLQDKLFEDRGDAEEWLEAIARKYYKFHLSDMEAEMEPDEFAERKAEYDRLGGFQVEQGEDSTIYWGPRPEHEDCRHGCSIATVLETELVLHEVK